MFESYIDVGFPEPDDGEVISKEENLEKNLEEWLEEWTEDQDPPMEDEYLDAYRESLTDMGE